MKRIICLIVVLLFLPACSAVRIDAEADLRQSIIRGDYELAKEAIQKGADINRLPYIMREYVTGYRKTSSPALLALDRGRFQIAQYLIDSGADVNYRDKKGKSLLQYCAQNYPRMIRSVLQAGADISYVDPTGNSALDYAAQFEVNNTSETAFDILLEYGAVPTAKTLENLLNDLSVSKYGMLKTTFLQVGRNNADLALYGAFIDDENIIKTNIDQTADRRNVLGGIAAFGSYDLFSSVFKREDVAYADQLIQAAAQYGNSDVMSFFIEHAKEIPFHDEKGALYYATKSHDLNLIDQIYHSELSNPLCWEAIGAIENNDIDLLNYFLDQGADTEVICLFGSMLGNACFYNNTEAIRLLLERGCNVNETGVRYGWPLITCISNGNVEAVKMLLEYGADLFTATNGEGTALMSAVRHGQFECVQLLVEHGADLNYSFPSGTSIMDAAQYGSQKIETYLLNCK